MLMFTLYLVGLFGNKEPRSCITTSFQKASVCCGCKFNCEAKICDSLH